MKNMTGAIYVAGALDYETRKRVSTCFFDVNETYFLRFFFVFEKIISLKKVPEENSSCKKKVKFAISK